MPASLLTQRPRHATCQGVRDASQVWPGTCRGRWDAGEFGRVLEGPPAGRVGAQKHTPSRRPGTGRMHVLGRSSIRARGARLGGVFNTPLHRGTCIRYVHSVRAFGPFRGRQGRQPSLPGTRPDSPASADARPYTGYVHSDPFGYPASFAGVRRRPEAGAVLIGISVRLHLVFASGFLSVCEGKGLCVRRACQYVILRISSPPCAWPECSFTGALFAAYQRRVLPRVFSKSMSRKQSFTSQLTLRKSGFSGGRGGKRKPGTR